MRRRLETDGVQVSAGRFAPVIKYLRDVTDPGRRFTQPQHEFEILDAIEGGIEPRPGGQFTPDAKQMTDVHGAPEIFRRPIGLEERFDQRPRRIIQLVFV